MKPSIILSALSLAGFSASSIASKEEIPQSNNIRGSARVPTKEYERIADPIYENLELKFGLKAKNEISRKRRLTSDGTKFRYEIKQGDRFENKDWNLKCLAIQTVTKIVYKSSDSSSESSSESSDDGPKNIIDDLTRDVTIVCDTLEEDDERSDSTDDNDVDKPYMIFQTQSGFDQLFDGEETSMQYEDRYIVDGSGDFDTKSVTVTDVKSAVITDATTLQLRQDTNPPVTYSLWSLGTQMNLKKLSRTCHWPHDCNEGETCEKSESYDGKICMQIIGKQCTSDSSCGTRHDDYECGYQTKRHKQLLNSKMCCESTTNDICDGYTHKEGICDKHENCGNNLFCDGKGVCQKKLDIGKECKEDIECQSNNCFRHECSI